MKTDDGTGPREAADEVGGCGAEPQPEEASLERRLVDAALEIERLRETHKRAQADLVNYRRRAEQELEDARKFGKSRLLEGSLPVMDDFERALALVPEDAVATGWLEGLRLVSRKMRQWMEAEGVTQIEAKGAPFSPEEHEAVGYEAASEGVPEGHVVTVIREGYRLHGRVLRASQVTVARPSDEG